MAALFEKTFTINAELTARVEELERELSVWKEAFKTADGDRRVLNKSVLKLERSIGALKVRTRLLSPRSRNRPPAPFPFRLLLRASPHRRRTIL